MMDETLDPLRLQYALFDVAGEVARSRGLDPLTRNHGPPAEASDEKSFASSVADYARRLPKAELGDLQLKLARAFLRELDFRMSPSPQKGSVDGSASERRGSFDSTALLANSAACQDPEAARVALVSLPWMAPGMPSIQLATLAAALEPHGIACDRFELFVDYAAAIGTNLYNRLGSAPSFTGEWVFARHYFGPQDGDFLHGYWPERLRFGLANERLEEQVLNVLGPVTRRFLIDVADGTDWSRYDLIGFSLTISQVASSLALARLIKQRHPGGAIVFGGAGCAGSMGKALLKLSPHLDAVVHIEGEEVLRELACRAQEKRDFSDLAGVSFRRGEELIFSARTAPLYSGRADRAPLNYDAYFARLKAQGIDDRLEVWLPFEGSRGCWYGEKRQCTFCGLHEIMKFRRWRSEQVLAELDHLKQRHGIVRFFAVDLILPRQFFDSLLPELAESDRDWTLFYEVKANMTRAEVELLAAAGIRWIQPGVESLDRDLLRLMKKGVSPIQNLQLLRWCRELGIRASWNLLTGIPGATVKMYRRMIRRLARFHHLAAPTGFGDLQLHRFSPYFEHPEKFGIRSLGPSPLYRHIFPVDHEVLTDLVYMHEFENLDSSADGYHDELRQSVLEWKRAQARSAALDFTKHDDGCAVIVDTRTSEDATTWRLDPAEADLYQYLDTARSERTWARQFQQAHPAAHGCLGGAQGITTLVERWRRRGLILVDGGRLLALAVDGARRRTAATVRSPMAPVPYLEEQMAAPS